MSVNLYNAETNELELLAGASEIPRWSGTQAEFNALDKDTLADGTIIEITDDLSNIFSTWTGTSAEFEALDKSTLADGCYINITDDESENMEFHVGDEFTIPYTVIAGRIGWAGKTIYEGIPLPKKIGSDVKSVSVTLIETRSYLCTYNNAYQLSSLNKTITPSIGDSSFVTLKIDLSSALSPTDGIVNMSCEGKIYFN